MLKMEWISKQLANIGIILHDTDELYDILAKNESAYNDLEFSFHSNSYYKCLCKIILRNEG